MADPTLEDLARFHEEAARGWAPIIPAYTKQHNAYAALVRRTMRESAEVNEALKRLESVVDDLRGNQIGGFW